MALGSSGLRRLNGRDFSGGLLATPQNNRNDLNNFKNVLTTLGVDIKKYDDEQLQNYLEQARAQGMSLLELMQLFGMGLNGERGEFHDPWNRSDAKRQADMALIGDVIKELGLSSHKEDIEKLANNGDKRVDYEDKNGNHKLDFGEILTLHSQTKGDVKIQVGGDGEINGGDDQVLAQSTVAATNSASTGLSSVNQNVSATNGEDAGLSNDELNSLRAGVLHRGIEGAGDISPTSSNSGSPAGGSNAGHHGSAIADSNNNGENKPKKPEGSPA